MPTTQATLITAAGTADSSERYGCPGVHRVEDTTDSYVITREIDDPEVHAALVPHVGVDAVGRPEHVGAVPPWVPCQLMDLPTLERFMDDHLHQRGDSVFRMETLPRYDVASDPNWARWRDGDDIDWQAKRAWLDELADHTARGIHHYRVRRFGCELTEHETYECNLGYALNGPAGEDIRVMREGEHDVPPDLLDCEYWVVNDWIALPALYDGAGRFIGAGWLGPRESAQFIADRDRAWAAAEPFASWWTRHPELHRNSCRTVA